MRNADLYAQRLTSSGTILWTHDGVVVSESGTIPDYQGEQSVLPDGTGGAFLAWQDRRNGVADYVFLGCLDPLGVVTCEKPVPVTLSDLMATPREGFVEIRWSAALDTQASMQVLRSTGTGGAFRAVSDELAGAPGISDFAFRDTSVEPATAYAYRIGWRETGAWNYSEPVYVTTLGGRFGIVGITPDHTGTATTRFAFSLAQPGETRIDVYDVAGKLVRTVARGDFTTGVHIVEWDGRTRGGRPVAAGVYFARLHSNREVSSRKFVIFR
jgi:hypothetical protein